MSEKIKVGTVKDSRDWESDDGKVKLTFYTLDIERNGTTQEVDHARQQGKPAPQPGEEIDAIFEPGKFREKMKKAPSQGGSGGGKRDWQPESQRDPERSARILRQHSQQAALEYAVQVGALQKLNAETTDPRTTVPDFFWRLVDQFDADVNKAGQAATQAQGISEGASSPARELPGWGPGFPPPNNDSHWWFEDHLMKAGLDGTGAKRLATFILDRFDAEQGKRAEQGLSDIDTMGETLAKLETAFRTTEGENLPKDGSDMEDLPF